MESTKQIARCPNTYWDAHQEKLARAFREAIEQTLEDLPEMTGLQFPHAAAVLRQFADDLS